MKERRGKKRGKRRFLVRYGARELSHSGFTRDISKRGAFIVSSSRPPLDSKLHVQIFLERERCVYFEALVTRHKIVSPHLRSLEKGGFGVRFLLPQEILQQMVVKQGLLEILYATPGDLKQAYERQLRYGGVFVPTERELRRGSEVLLRIRLDFAKQTLEFDATVVHVWTNATQTDTRGVGVVFNDRKEVEAAIEPFVGKNETV